MHFASLSNSAQKPRKVIPAERQRECTMQDMTPEERLARIENLLATVVESQARHDGQIEKQNAVIENQNAVLEKHAAAIQDLIVISRTLL